MNPRIQVEHTVTEEVTDVDLVQSQLRIAAGETLADLGLDQDTIRLRGAALQCRITTEDPTNGFRPDTGRITTYRSPGGGGVRLDGGTTYTGAEVSAHFDSMLAKLTCRGRTFEMAVQKARRAVDEFRIRGVATNIPFLRAVLDEPDFLAGRLNTSFIEDHPGLLTARPTADRGTRLLTWLAEVTVNKPHGERPVSVDPADQAAGHRPRRPGARRLPSGPALAWARGLRARSARADAGRGHRHHLPRRPPVAAGHPGAHPRPAHGRRSRLPDDAGAAQRRGLGRRDVRRGAAVPPRGPVGAARQAAPGRAEHLPADAAARSQHRRLHAVPDRGHRRVRAGGRRDRHRHLPHLRRPQRRRADAPGDRGGAEDRDHRRRGRALLHRRPEQPGREALHPRLLPRARRADRRRRRARPRDQGHGRAVARARRPHPGDCAARALRPAGAPAHPRHPRRPARDPARRHRRRGRRGRRGVRLDGGYDVASRRCPPSSPPPTTPTGRPASTSRRSAPWSRTGRPPAASTHPSSPGSPRRPAASTPTRSPAASSPTCASRRSRSGSARSSSRSRTCTPPPTTSSATSSR